MVAIRKKQNFLWEYIFFYNTAYQLLTYSKLTRRFQHLKQTPVRFYRVPLLNGQRRLREVIPNAHQSGPGRITERLMWVCEFGRKMILKNIFLCSEFKKNLNIIIRDLTVMPIDRRTFLHIFLQSFLPKCLAIKQILKFASEWFGLNFQWTTEKCIKTFIIVFIAVTIRPETRLVFIDICQEKPSNLGRRDNSDRCIVYYELFHT